jgi:lysozyme
MNALGVDVSRWQRTVEWNTLRDAGVSFAVVKASQGTRLIDPLLRTHLEGARSVGMVTGVYHWADPTQPARDPVDHFLRVSSGLAYDFAALDVEQEWQSWQEWAAKKVIRRLLPEQISSHARETAEMLRAAANKPVLLYTRPSFVKDYALPMQYWLPEWPLWLAYYPYPSSRVYVTWEDLIQRHLPKIAGPKLPPGGTDWRIWQFSADRFVLPGVSGPLDLNFYHGSEADLRAWIGKPHAAAPGLSDAEKLARLWQAHPELGQS